MGIEIPVILRLNGRTAHFPAKIDTGASFCIFRRAYAEQLGIDVEGGLLTRVVTATGEHFDAYGHTVAIESLDSNFESTVYFAARAEYKRNVLGRLGWLQKFRLALIDYETTLFLSHYDD